MVHTKQFTLSYWIESNSELEFLVLASFAFCAACLDQLEHGESI